jgi:hypothetical protein
MDVDARRRRCHLNWGQRRALHCRGAMPILVACAESHGCIASEGNGDGDGLGFRVW